MIAALTDALDGYLARKYHLTSDVGKFLDPVADKLFVLLPLIWFASRGVVSVWLVMLIAARDLVISAFRMLGASRGIVLCASALGKMKTVSQIALLGALTLSWGYTAQYIGAAAAVLTVASAAEYIYRNRGILSMLKQ
jgi:CDP-diacylglycerol--glycerol-3-phosphate 3-phosphatidyltransferase